MTIEEGIASKKTEMYDTVKKYVADQKSANMATNSLFSVMATLDADKYPQYITVPTDLHFADMDYYSIPEWNASLVKSIRSLGGTAQAYLYKGNTHELTVDDNAPAGSWPDERRPSSGRSIVSAAPLCIRTSICRCSNISRGGDGAGM